MDKILENITPKFINNFLKNIKFYDNCVYCEDLFILKGTTEWREAFKLSCIQTKKFEVYKLYNELSFNETELVDTKFIKLIKVSLRGMYDSKKYI